MPSQSYPECLKRFNNSADESLSADQAASATDKTPNPNQKIEALIFDCDGTLVSSMDFFYSAWDKLSKKYNYSFTREEFYSLAGLPVNQVVEFIFRKNNVKPEDIIITPQSIKQYSDEQNEILLSMRKNGEYPLDIKVVTDIARRNIALSPVVGQNGRVPMAVASSGHRHHVLTDLRYNGLLKELFSVEENLLRLDEDFSKNVGGVKEEWKGLEKDYKDDNDSDKFKYITPETFLIVTRENVEKGKPDPDLFLEACRRLGVNPENCIGFEDADLGIESLRNAGFKEENIVDVRKLEGYNDI